MLHRSTLAASFSDSGAFVSYKDAPSSRADRSRHQQPSLSFPAFYSHTHTGEHTLTHTQKSNSNILHDKYGDSGRINWNLPSPVTPAKHSRAGEPAAVDSVRGHHVSPCIPSRGLEIETPHPEHTTLSSRPPPPPVFSSLHVAKQGGEGDSSSAGKKVKRGCLSSAHHLQLPLHNLWAYYCNQKFFFSFPSFFFFFFSWGRGGLLADTRWRQCSPPRANSLPAKPGPFHVK